MLDNCPYRVDNIYLVDALEALREIPDESIDMVFTDPPFNISSEGQMVIDVRGKEKRAINYDFGDWDKFTEEEYRKFTNAWVTDSVRALKFGGNFVTYFGKQNMGLLVDFWKRYDWYIKDILVICRTNPVPQMRKVKFMQGTEFIFWGVKGNKEKLKKDGIRPTFNYQLGQHPNYWIKPILGGKERLKVYDEKTGKIKVAHPTQKREDITEDLIKYLSNEGDIILDPFCGVGTHCVVAKRLGRHFIGFENNELFFRLALERLGRVKMENAEVCG